MGAKGECSDIDASTGTRIWTPSSNSNHEVSAVETKKRKREGYSMEDLLDESFVVKPHPSTVFTKPRTLIPIALIPRTHVSLSFLDILSPSGSLPASRLFEAHVKVLELEERMGDTPAVLIAQCDDKKSIFVVERVEQNIYVLCKLGSWVSISLLCTGAIISRYESIRAAANCPESRSVLYEKDAESQITPESSKYSKKKRLAIEAIQSLVKRPIRDGQPTMKDQGLSSSAKAGTAMNSQLSRGPEVTVVQQVVDLRPMAVEIFDNIRSHYFEALYLSKASLAYFAKGPLSRARAAFHLDYDSTLEMNELIEFLESLTLPTAVVDRKYKDGVPNLLSTLMPDGSPEDGNKTPPKVKKLKSRKLKPGKNGLYSAEDTYISRWWGSYDTDASKESVEGSKEDLMKKRVAQLRIREMQLQIIVILETLALKSLVASPADQSGELPSCGQADGMLGCKITAGSKSKKRLDLAALIEVNVDRLCIWQSLAAEDSRTTSILDTPSNLGSRPSGLASTHNHAADVLREFCVEVIVPFFSARLPEQCAGISRKLGGPVVVSPTRPKSTLSAGSSTLSSRPGGIKRRSVHTTARRSLRRVITDERHAREGSRGAHGAISLMRSATAPAIPGLKRERSETPLLASIPLAESQSMLVSRGGVLKSKKFSQREVDLSNLATINDAKAKKASIEAELKDAITALKRPNRQLAGQMQLEADKRAASAITNSRKSKKPVRNPSFRPTQILSTPKGNRREGPTELYPMVELDLEQRHEFDFVPQSSIPRVPLSVVRTTSTQNSEKGILCEATPSRPGNKIVSAIYGTPSRGQIKSSSCPSGMFLEVGLQNYDAIPPSPLQKRGFGRQQSLNASLSFDQAVECTPSMVAAVHGTPFRHGNPKLSGGDAFTNPPSIVVQNADIEETENTNVPRLQRNREDDDSIYKSLGWDDYDDLA